MPPGENDVKMRILLAAKKLFAKQGYDATSVRQICEEAGVNLALVSYHFGGKENVLYAMFQTFLPVGRMQEFEEELSDPVTGIRRLIREVVTLRESNTEIITILQQEIILFKQRVELLQKLTFPLWSKFRELLALGREQGRFEFQSLDNTLLFTLGSIFLYKQRDYFLPLLTEEKPDVEEMIEQTCTFVLNAVKYRGN